MKATVIMNKVNSVKGYAVKVVPYVLCCVLAILLFKLVTAPIAFENKINQTEASVIAKDVTLPDGYTHFGDSRWITDQEWTGLVIDSRGVSNVSGDSKDCYIYQMYIHKIGYGVAYSVTPVLEMDGTPATVPFDGIRFG